MRQAGLLALGFWFCSGLSLPSMIGRSSDGEIDTSLHQRAKRPHGGSPLKLDELRQFLCITSGLTLLFF
jgi:hypothetical protein